MTATQFKLTKPDGLTRRITFAEQPSWLSLASKIETLYGIPIEKIGVSYVDSDGDEVTLSTHEELDDFYKLSQRQGEVIKFTVQDLSSLRSTPVPSVSPPGHSRFFPPTQPQDLFGGIMFDATPGEWTGLAVPEMFVGLPPQTPRRPDSRTSVHSAFVEVVESDVRSNDSKNDDEDRSTQNETETVSSGILDMPILSPEDKGKAKAMQPSVEDDSSSTASLIADEEPQKFPVHVFDVSGSDQQTITDSAEPKSQRSVTSSPTQRGFVVTESPVDSLLVPISPVLSPVDLVDERPKSTPVEAAADPPLPPLESLPSAPSASLTNDVAHLLDALVTAFSAHPELSEGLRNVVRNAVSGTYWTAQREAVNQAAAEFTQASTQNGRAANELRSAEEEAGKRVTEAIGSVFRVVAEITSSVMGTAHSNPLTLSQPARASPTVPAEPASAANINVPFIPPYPERVISPELPEEPDRQRATRRGAWREVAANWQPYDSSRGEETSHLRKPWGQGRWPLPPFPPPPFGAPPAPPPLIIPQPPHTHGPLPPPPPPIPPFYTHPQPPMFAPLGPPPTRWQSGWSARQGRSYAPPPAHTMPDLLSGNPWMSEFPRLNQDQDESRTVPPTRSERPAPVVGFYGADVVPPTEVADVRPAGPNPRVSPHERKAQLEAAKQYYKAEKEKWRKEREERRKERREEEERKLDNSGDNVPARNESTLRKPGPSIKVEAVSTGPALAGPSRARPSSFAQIVSNPRGPYPQLEMFGLPRRHQHQSHQSHRAFPQDIGISETQRDTVKLGQRVTKRLHDMGFTESAYPILSQILPDYLRPNGVPTKDTEDAIITKLLETLLQISPRPPHASSSGAKRDRDLPGAWQGA